MHGQSARLSLYTVNLCHPSGLSSAGRGGGVCQGVGRQGYGGSKTGLPHTDVSPGIAMSPKQPRHSLHLQQRSRFGASEVVTCDWFLFSADSHGQCHLLLSQMVMLHASDPRQ